MKHTITMKHIFSKQNKALLSELVRTDFKLRYQGSVLGYAWSLLRPLLLFIILYVVFVKFLRIGNGVPNYPIYLLLGIVLWNFFAEMTSQGLSAIVGRGDLIRKIRIPRWMIIVSTSISALINLTLNMVVVIVIAIIGGMHFLTSSVFLPLFLLEIYLFALGITLFLSALFVKYRDVSYIWEVCLQAGFYITPVIYPLSLIKNVNVQKLILMNPLGQAVQDARNVFVTHATITNSEVFHNQFIRIIPISIVILVLILGVWYFKKHAKSFAEDL